MWYIVIQVSFLTRAGVTPLNQNICVCGGSALMGRPVRIHYIYVRMYRIQYTYVNIHIYIYIYIWYIVTHVIYM